MPTYPEYPCLACLPAWSLYLPDCLPVCWLWAGPVLLACYDPSCTCLNHSLPSCLLTSCTPLPFFDCLSALTLCFAVILYDWGPAWLSVAPFLCCYLVWLFACMTVRCPFVMLLSCLTVCLHDCPLPLCYAVILFDCLPAWLSVAPLLCCYLVWLFACMTVCCPFVMLLSCLTVCLHDCPLPLCYGVILFTCMIVCCPLCYAVILFTVCLYLSCLTSTCITFGLLPCCNQVGLSVAPFCLSVAHLQYSNLVWLSFWLSVIPLRCLFISYLLVFLTVCRTYCQTAILFACLFLTFCCPNPSFYLVCPCLFGYLLALAILLSCLSVRFLAYRAPVFMIKRISHMCLLY